MKKGTFCLDFSKNTIFYHYMRLRFMEKKTHMPGTCSDNKNNIFLYKMKPGSMFALISMSYSMKKSTFCSDFVKNTIFCLYTRFRLWISRHTYLELVQIANNSLLLYKVQTLIHVSTHLQEL